MNDIKAKVENWLHKLGFVGFKDIISCSQLRENICLYSCGLYKSGLISLENNWFEMGRVIIGPFTFFFSCFFLFVFSFSPMSYRLLPLSSRLKI